jgi:hypothetical protein
MTATNCASSCARVRRPMDLCPEEVVIKRIPNSPFHACHNLISRHNSRQILHDWDRTGSCSGIRVSLSESEYSERRLFLPLGHSSKLVHSRLHLKIELMEMGRAIQSQLSNRFHSKHCLSGDAFTIDSTWRGSSGLSSSLFSASINLFS